MPVPAAKVISIVETWAPRRLAEDWDNPGWQVGDPRAQVQKVLVALDASPEVLARAQEIGAELIITHHPLVFRPLKHLRDDMPEEAHVAAFLRAGVAVYSAHTNLDHATGGTSAVLAERLGLTAQRILAPRESEKLFKIVVFVPLEHVDNVRQALAAAGAGWIGGYSHCTFQVEGTGTFLPQEGTNPYIGTPGILERVREARLETIVPAARLGQAVSNMLRAHPYEEVAYDVYPLALEGKSFGLGCLGELPQAETLEDFGRRMKGALGLTFVTVYGDLNRVIKRVAVCGGSGASLIGRAKAKGADVLVTGDIRYHDAQAAELAGLALIDAGHAGTENPVVEALAMHLAKELAEEDVEVVSFLAEPHTVIL